MKRREELLVADEDAAIRAARDEAEGPQRQLVEHVLEVRALNARVARLRAVADAARAGDRAALAEAIRALEPGDVQTRTSLSLGASFVQVVQGLCSIGREPRKVAFNWRLRRLSSPRRSDLG